MAESITMEHKKFKDLTIEDQYTHALKTFLREKRKFINFTKNYHLSDSLKDKAFNIQFNKTTDLQTLFDAKHNYTKEFYEALRTRITNNDHIVIVFFGHTNSGKSWAAIRISEIIKKLFLHELDSKSTIFLSFSDVEYKRKLPKMRNRDIMIRDETPNLSGKGTRTIQKNLKNVLAVTRAGQYCFLFISPDRTIIKSNAVSFYLESAGINKVENKTRFILYDGSMIPLGRIFITRPRGKIFLRDYERQKLKNIDDLIKSAGSVGFNPDMDHFKLQISTFATYCRERAIRKKGEIKSQIHFFNAKFPNLKISSVAGEDDDIVNNVSINLKQSFVKEKKETKQMEQVSKIYEDAVDFVFDMKNLDKLMKKQATWRNINRDIKIHDIYLSGDVSLSELAERYKGLNSPQAVNAIINKVKGLLYRIRGELFEKQFYEYLKKKYERDPDIMIKPDGGNGKPDIIIMNKKISELVILSLKCIDLPRATKKYPKYLKWRGKKFIGGFEPEITYAGKYINDYKTVNVFIIVCSASSGKVKSFLFDIQHKKMIKIESEF